MHEAVRLLFLLAGVSYYKTAAPPVIDLGDHGLTEAEERLLRAFYIDGLGEYAYRNGLDLSGLRIDAPRRPAPALDWRPAAGRPLIPFGGGIDSIVTVESVRARATDPGPVRRGHGGRALRRHRGGGPPSPACPWSGPSVSIDPKVREAARLRMNFRNGHVPVTGVISAIAITRRGAGRS